jgi:hypothetical protein
MPAKSENFMTPPFRACGLFELCGAAKLDAASIAAPIVNIATESSNRLCMFLLPVFDSQRTLLATLFDVRVKNWLVGSESRF